MQLTEMLSLIVKGFWETLYMTLGSTVLAYAIGLPLGLLLILTITGITMVIINLNRADHRLEKKTPFSEKTLIELQTKPKLQMTEL